jgi:hypothetical protein
MPGANNFIENDVKTVGRCILEEGWAVYKVRRPLGFVIILILER